MPEEYIKRSDCLEAMKKAEKWWWNAEDLRQYYDLINSIPAADVRPKRHARWLDMDDYLMCSNCGAPHNEPDKNYCPNCGAKTEGGGKNVNFTLLKEQVARVMKPEEIPDYDGAIYLEDFGEPEIVIAVYDRGVAGRVKFAIRGTRSTIAGYNDYNKRWRAWTSRPTDKQRENTPWEIEHGRTE